MSIGEHANVYVFNVFVYEETITHQFLRKKPPAHGTNQIAGFGKFRSSQTWKKNKINYKLKVFGFIYIKQNLLAHWNSVSATEAFVRSV